ncbi:UPF0005-domain-containing protein [Ramicandelaber brevisporus]|nr:UPF0005-domain-containing protein [Ramicandelaber brevisporus]
MTSVQQPSQHYTAPPPEYTAVPVDGSNENTAFLGGSGSGTHQQQPGLVVFKPDVVSQSQVSVRMAFIGKVYSILFAQLLTTVVICAAARVYEPLRWYLATSEVLVPMLGLGGLFVLFGLFYKRHSYPLNMILLSVFTLCEATMLAGAVALFDSLIVLQALLVTLGIFIGLSLYTLQSKRDFSGMGPILTLALWGLLITGLVQLFVPFSNGVALAKAVGTALLFSGFIVYDTYNLMERYTPDEFVVASIDLYLDIVNLFLAILEIFARSERD